MRTVYIAAPYRGAGTLGIYRARGLARLALSLGYAPIVIHDAIAAGVYGDDDDPEQRARGLAAACALAALANEVWVLTRDDGTLSEGVAAEVGAAGDRQVTVATWREWMARGARLGRLGRDRCGDLIVRTGQRVAFALPDQWVYYGVHGEQRAEGAASSIREASAAVDAAAIAAGWDLE